MVAMSGNVNIATRQRSIQVNTRLVYFSPFGAIKEMGTLPEEADFRLAPDVEIANTLWKIA
jgi:hypothetical protein